MQTKVYLSVTRGFLAAVRHDPPICHVLAPRFFKGNARRAPRPLRPGSAGSSVDPRSAGTRGRTIGISRLRTTPLYRRQPHIMAVYGVRARDFFFMRDAPSEERDTGAYPTITSTGGRIRGRNPIAPYPARVPAIGVRRFPVGSFAANVTRRRCFVARFLARGIFLSVGPSSERRGEHKSRPNLL